MWDAVAPGHVLQVQYYRYLTFGRDGQCCYAMTHLLPEIIASKLAYEYRNLTNETGNGNEARTGHTRHESQSISFRRGFYTIRPQSGLTCVVEQTKTFHNCFQFDVDNGRLWPTGHTSYDSEDGDTSRCASVIGEVGQCFCSKNVCNLPIDCDITCADA